MSESFALPDMPEDMWVKKNSHLKPVPTPGWVLPTEKGEAT